MAKLWAVIRREYLERVRSKWFLIGTFLGPVFMLVITVMPIWLASRTKATAGLTNIQVLDATGSPIGARVAAKLGAMPAEAGGGATPALKVVTPEELSNIEAAATKAVMAKEIKGYLVLSGVAPADLKVRYAGRNASTVNDMQVLRDAVRTSLLAMRLEGAGLDPARISELTSVRVPMEEEVLDDRGRAGGGSGKGSIIVGYLVSFLLYMMITLYGQNILRGVLEEKTTRVAEVVVASVRPDVLLAGKVLGAGAVGITQQLIWILSGVLIYTQRVPMMKAFGIENLPFSLPTIGAGFLAVTLLFYIFGFLFYASLFAAVGAMVSNQEDAQQAAMPVTIILIMSVIFMQPLLLAPSGNMARIMTLVPSASPMLMPLRMSMVDVSAWEVALSLAILAGACAVSIYFSARIYRVGLLMYGKKPSFAEVIRWIRYAG
jgi:ABC-2 type transport system permease protein